MSFSTVSAKGQVVIPLEIRQQLGIVPGCQLDFTLEGNAIHVEIRRQMPVSGIDEGFGMLTCNEPGKRSLADFDVADAMREGLDGRD